MAKETKVILTCTECLSRNYVTHRNPKTHNQRLELMKFCKKCGKHTLHKGNSMEVLIFCAFFGVFFVACEFFVSFFLKLIGIGA